MDRVTAGTTRDPATVGPYRLVRKLGEGGMGVVHLATDPAGRAVALKVLRAHVANDEEARRRLGREVTTLRRVRHPRVAEVLDADVSGAEPYLVTRFVPGRSLEEEVRDTGPLPAGQVARIGRGLAEALSAIHAVGVVHRDVKPANVMLVDGDPVVIDFGIAHIADESRITRTGLVMGTPGYLSPELIYGGAVTTATDWWAWGATLAFAATGRQPFGTGPIAGVLERVRLGRSDLDGVEPGLRELLAATLSADAGRRPTSAQLMARLDGVIAGVTTAPSVAGPDDPTSRTSPPLDRTRRMPPVGSAGAQQAAPAAGRPRAADARDANARRAADPRAAGRPGSAPIPPFPGAARTAYPPPPVPYPQQQVPYPQQYAPPSGPPGYPAPAQPHQPQGHQPYRHGYHQPDHRSYPQAGPGGPVPTARSNRAPSAGGPAQAGRQPWPPVTEEGRITGTLAAITLALAAVAAVAPGGAVVLAFCWSVLARLVQRSTAGLQRRRQELGGPSSTDVAVTVAALPWRLLMSMVMSVLTLFLPALVAASAAFIVGSVLSGDGVPRPAGALALCAGMVAGAVTSWWGPGGWSLRTGSRAVVRAVTRGRGGRIAVATACVLVAVAAMMVATNSGFTPDWSPFPAPTGLTGRSIG